MAKGKYQEWLTPEGLLKLEAWARNGLTDEQIAKNVGINPDTLYTWKKKYTEISESLKKGKEIIDILVENALLKRALGYSYDEETYESAIVYKFDVDKDGNDIQIPTETKEVLTKRVKKHQVPDTTAQIFWLKNRKPDVWRDRKETELSGSLNTTTEMTEAQLEEQIKKLEHKLGIDSSE